MRRFPIHNGRIRSSRFLTSLLVLLLTSGSPAEEIPRPPAPDPVDPAALAESIERGRAYLFESQNANGSWGSPRRTKGLNIYAPVPAAHHAFRAGTTSLALGGLLETNPADSDDLPPKEAEVIARARSWMLSEMPKLRRSSSDALYNIWGHAYGILTLTRMHESSTDPAEKSAIISELRNQVDRLTRYELINGGWGYYDFVAQTARPSGSPTSFTTATVLHAVHEMQARTKVEFPSKLVDRALVSIRRQRQPDHAFAYGEYLRMRPRADINRPGGSLGRSVACNSILHLHKDDRVDEQVLIDSLDRLFARNGWLDIGRKRPIPHEAWFGVAGYFYYYGHYYGGLTIDLLPEDRRDFYRDHMAGLLIHLQEKDGSWWDYPLYDYHQPYGTGFALMTLARCHKEQTKKKSAPGKAK